MGNRSCVKNTFGGEKMNQEKEVVRLNPISNGTVLDHLPIKSAFKIINLLELSLNDPVMVAVNIDSKKMGRKDLIFIEGKELSQKEVQKIGLIAQGSTWNTVKDRKVFSKKKIQMPYELIGIVRCSNPKCITNHEEIDTKFVRNEKIITCNYCEKEMKLNEAIQNIK